MQAAVFKNQKICLTDVPVPVPSETEALVRINLAGICATDSELLKGYHNFEGIPGHEFVGVVESAPEKVELEGCRVVADINCGCGRCDICLSGDQRHCGSRTVVGIRGRNGVFAEFCVIPISNLFTVPDTIEDKEAVFAEPLAAALEIVRQVDISERSRIAVLGDGKMGLLCALVLQQFAKNLTLFGRHQQKLNIAARQGVHTLCRSENGSDETSAVQAKDFDIVVETTGNANGINEAICMVRPEGTVVVKTTSVKKSEIDFATVVVNEVRLIGSRCGDIAHALNFMEKKVIDLYPMIEAVYPLDDFETAFFHAAKKGSLKVLVGNENEIKSQK